MSQIQKYSITALSKKLKLDRGTVRERLEEMGFEAVSSGKGKETLYELTPDDLKSLGNDEYEVERIRKTKAEADLKEHQLKIQLGEFGSVAEFTEIVAKIFKSYKAGIKKSFVKNKKKLHEANSETEMLQIIENVIETESNELRRDWEKYIGRS